MLYDYYSYDLKSDIYPADLVIAKNGAILNYNLETGDTEEIEINKHDEDGYKMYVYEGLKYENNKFIVRNPTYLQLVSDDFKTIDKEELPKEINYSPYISSLTFFNDKLYYVSNSHVNDKMQAVSCEYYDGQVECLDGVIDTYVKSYNNKLYSLLDYDSVSNKNYALLRIRDDKQVKEYTLDLKSSCDNIHNFTIYNDHLYILYSTYINDDDETIYLAKLNMNLQLTDKIELSSNESYSNMYIYKDVVYLYSNSYSDIDECYLSKFAVSNLEEIEKIMFDEIVKYSNKQDFVDDKLFIYHGNSLGINDIDDNEMVYNKPLSLPTDYSSPYDTGSVTIRLHDKTRS